MTKINIEINEISTKKLLNNDLIDGGKSFEIVKYEKINLSSYNFLADSFEEDSSIKNRFGFVINAMKKDKLKFSVNKVNENKYFFHTTIDFETIKNLPIIDFYINIIDDNMTIDIVNDSICFDINSIETQKFSSGVLSFINRTLIYVKSPLSIKEKINTKEERKKTKRVKGKKIVTTKYIYKEIYKISNVEYERRNDGITTEREYYLSEWNRKGHYRKYRDKKTGEIKKIVWIESTVCKAHGKIKENSVLKITKIS